MHTGGRAWHGASQGMRATGGVMWGCGATMRDGWGSAGAYIFILFFFLLGPLGGPVEHFFEASVHFLATDNLYVSSKTPDMPERIA